jgi:channel protein (hemolysin III family)
VSLIRDIHQIDVMPWLGCREPFSAISHLMGAAVYAGLAYRFIALGRGNWIRTISLSVMAVASVLLLLMSGIYHVCWPGPLREIMLRADVVGVFVLIAASMTPAHAILFTGWARWGSLILIWTVAILGIAWRLVYWDTTHGSAAIIVFLLFGWGSLITGIILWGRFGWTFIQPAILSGIAYSLGAIVLMRDRLVLISGVIGPHEIWHIAVLAGIALQWYFISQFASGCVQLSSDAIKVRETASTR